MIVRETLNFEEDMDPYDALNIGNKNTEKKAYALKTEAERAMSDKSHKYHDYSFTTDDYRTIDNAAYKGNEYGKLFQKMRQRYMNDFGRMREAVRLKQPTASAVYMLEYQESVMIYFAIESGLTPK